MNYLYSQVEHMIKVSLTDDADDDSVLSVGLQPVVRKYIGVQSTSNMTTIPTTRIRYCMFHSLNSV